MAIPTSITDLDTNEAMNSPAGSDNVGGTLDNFLRSHAAIIRRQFSKGANVNSASTTVLPPDCSFLNVVKVVSTINGFTDSFDGRLIYLKFEAGITLAHSAALILPKNANITTQADDVACFLNEAAGIWRCISYPRYTQREVDASISALNSGKVSKAGDTMTGRLDIDSGIRLNKSTSSFSSAITSSNGSGGSNGAALFDPDGNFIVRANDSVTDDFRVEDGRALIRSGGSNREVWHTGSLDPMTRLGAQTTSGKIMRSAWLPGIASISSSGADGNAALAIDSAAGVDNSCSVIRFLRKGGSDYYAYLGLDSDNKWKVGGGYMGTNAYELWHAGTFNPASKANAGAGCPWNSGITEFGSVPAGLGNTGQSYYADCPSGYAMVGLRSQRDSSGNTNIWIRGVTIRNQ